MVKNHIVDKCWKLHGRPEWAEELIAQKHKSSAAHVTTQTIGDEPGNASTEEAELGNFSYALCTSNTACDSAWVVDTGATDYMTNNPKKFTTFSATTSNYIIKTATGTSAIVSIIGTVKLTPSMTLTNVLLVPTLDQDLLSVSKLMTTYSSHFFPKYCYFQDLHT